MYNIEQPHALYETHELVILSDQAAQPSDHAHLCRLPLDDSLIVSMNGIRIANMHKTLFDCGLTFDFPDALAIYDSAVRRGLDISGILTLCKHAKQDTSKVQRLVEHTNPLAENGGESKARGVIINMGFMPPKLQQNFTNPNNLDVPLRTDFLWYGPNGSIIVGEYDGMQKYGTEYSQISEHVARQSERDKALIKQGVTRIVHFTYTDVMNPSQLRYKLEQAGVPYSDPHVYARH